MVLLFISTLQHLSHGSSMVPSTTSHLQQRQFSSEGSSSSTESSPDSTRLRASPMLRAARELQLQEAQQQHRTWVWWDASDEAKEQRHELKRSYADAGYANLLEVPHSVKKMNRVIHLVRVRAVCVHVVCVSVSVCVCFRVCVCVCVFVLSRSWICVCKTSMATHFHMSII